MVFPFEWPGRRSTNLSASAGFGTFAGVWAFAALSCWHKGELHVGLFPVIPKSVAREKSIDLQGTKLFYYEANELELADSVWRPFSPGPQLVAPAHVIPPLKKQLEGFDVVILSVENSPDPEHSPLSCQGLAEKLPTNAHCLVETFDEAYTALNADKFDGCEPGACRIFSCVFGRLATARIANLSGLRSVNRPPGSHSFSNRQRRRKPPAHSSGSDERAATDSARRLCGLARSRSKGRLYG